MLNAVATLDPRGEVEISASTTPRRIKKKYKIPNIGRLLCRRTKKSRIYYKVNPALMCAEDLFSV